MRGYFGIGVESVSKQYNIGNLFRSAHAFGAGFVFTVDAAYEKSRGGKSDTSKSLQHLPFYNFPDVNSMILPQGCKLVGVELMDDSIELPSFRHPINAAYILGPERASLSSEVVEKCDYVVQIPSRFCLNVGIAGALVMYDRLISQGRFAPRAVRSGEPTEEMQEQVFGARFFRDPAVKACAEAMNKYRGEPPLAEVLVAEKDANYKK
ncbi:MAG: RNA methyltransferase [Alphaproteobacteria bacterium]|nr:RNA methyltransferase [Alphaproteobacteria bacterium]